jgi:hypothetical protein
MVTFGEAEMMLPRSPDDVEHRHDDHHLNARSFGGRCKAIANPDHIKPYDRVVMERLVVVSNVLTTS